MQKVQNVIKVFFIFFLCFNLKSFGQQKIQGRYSVPVYFAYEFYEFEKNGIFEYHKGADLGDDQYGKGHYKIRKDSLILNYDLTELKQESYFKAKKYYNLDDSVQVNLNIYNFNKEPLYNIIVSTSPEYQSTESDKNGNAYLKFKKGLNKEKIELHIDGAFWAKQVVYLDSDANYNISVFMNKSSIIGFGHPKAIKSTIEKYKILKHNKNLLKLKKGEQIITLKKKF